MPTARKVASDSSASSLGCYGDSFNACTADDIHNANHRAEIGFFIAAQHHSELLVLSL